MCQHTKENGLKCAIKKEPYCHIHCKLYSPSNDIPKDKPSSFRQAVSSIINVDNRIPELEVINAEQTITITKLKEKNLALEEQVKLLQTKLDTIMTARHNIQTFMDIINNLQ